MTATAHLKRTNRFRRVFTAFCGILILAGLAIAGSVLVFPVEMLDDEGRLPGEMPPAFAFGLLLAALGVLLAAAGGAVALLRSVWRATRHRRP
ncbi:hypothetical protein [Azospirillum halopraeferens]|uniref:hypothetical protein n=1 Tax=Azospirillum halopraeferens TaxID=34010 RepID=UPI00041BAC52|nr:hypothetical protein [Azospirillum halopraeferens]